MPRSDAEESVAILHTITTLRVYFYASVVCLFVLHYMGTHNNQLMPVDNNKVKGIVNLVYLQL